MIDYQKLLEILEATKERLEDSEDSAFASKTVKELIEIIDSNIDEIKSTSTCNLKELELLFGPTASLQETSIDNGWGEEFIGLSTIFDKVIKL